MPAPPLCLLPITHGTCESSDNVGLCQPGFRPTKHRPCVRVLQRSGYQNYRGVSLSEGSAGRCKFLQIPNDTANRQYRTLRKPFIFRYCVILSHLVERLPHIRRHRVGFPSANPLLFVLATLISRPPSFRSSTFVDLRRIARAHTKRFSARYL